MTKDRCFRNGVNQKYAEDKALQPLKNHEKSVAGSRFLLPVHENKLQVVKLTDNFFSDFRDRQHDRRHIISTTLATGAGWWSGDRSDQNSLNNLQCGRDDQHASSTIKSSSSASSRHNPLPPYRDRDGV